MAEKVTISILVLTYNHENYIRETLDGLLAQKCSFNYEILVGDDCSTDSTRSIIYEYEKKYPKIIVPCFSIKNVGQTQNLINLIKNANGDFISICDGDDFWLTNDVLQTQYETFLQNPDVGMVCAKARILDQNTQTLTSEILGYSGVESLLTMMKDNQDVAAPTISFERKLLLQCIDESTWYIENNYFFDTILTYWFSYKSRVKFIDKVLAAYRVSDESQCHSLDTSTRIGFERRYYAIKLRFILEHKDVLPSSDLYEILMSDYDSINKQSKFIGELMVRNTLSYKIGHFILKPFLFIKRYFTKL